MELNPKNKTITNNSSLKGIVGLILNTLKMIRYNLKIIFGNRFIYFLLSAIALTLFIVGVNLFNGGEVGETGIYRILTITGALLLFYPAAFGIQSDKDARTMEIIFGIPDYRYRVWFLRLMLIYAISTFVMIVIALLLRYTFESFSISLMIVRVLFPLAFLGFFTFYLSTVVRSGNATAAIVIVLGIILLILSEEISTSYWNVFFNPYENPSDKSELVWRALTTKNRIFLGAGSVVFLLGGLMNLQQREKLLG